MWSEEFLDEPKWEKIRNTLPVPIVRSWNDLSERIKRESVKRCAQKLMESESTSESVIDPFLRDIVSGEAFEPEMGPEDIASLIPKPNPLTENLVPLEKADPGIPGEIVVDANGKLLLRYLSYTGFTKFLRESYDEWLETGLKPLIQNQVIPVQGGRIKFDHVSLTRPRVGGHKLFPRMARDKGITYGLDIHAYVILEKDVGEDEVVRTVLGDKSSKTKKHLGTIPLMLGSKNCYLHNLSPSQLREVAEDPSDPFGYFVVSGSEKVILLHEKLRLNRIFVTSKKRGKDKDSEASITIETPAGSVRVNLVMGKGKRVNLETRFKAEVKPSRRSRKGKERGETLREPARSSITSKKDGNYRYIGVEKLFYILQLLEEPGITDEGDAVDTDRWPEEMTRKIVQFTRAEWKHKVTLETSMMKMLYPNDKPFIVKQEIARIKGGADLLDPESVDEVVKNLIDKELFPQLNSLGRIQNIYTLKSDLLAMMVARLIEVNLGLMPYDDRDSWSNKRLETASRAMEQLMRAIWRRFVNNIKKDLSDKKSIDSLSAIKTQIGKASTSVTQTFESSFVGTNWGVQGSMKTNMTQTPNRDSVVALLSHMHRVEVATNRNDKQPSIRMIHGTQWGYICPVESPEGSNCGIVKNLAVTAQVTYEKLDHNVIAKVLNAKAEDGSDLFSIIPSSRYTSPVLVNGKFLGWCAGRELRRHMVLARRERAIPLDTGITLNTRNNLLIHTDTSRLVRPLLVVEPTKVDGKEKYLPLILTKDLLGAPIKKLFEEGVIEYVDSFEVESVDFFVAETFEDTKNRRTMEKKLAIRYAELKKEMRGATKKKKSFLKVNLERLAASLAKIRNGIPFTHVEMDPTSILGISANIIPYPNHNQGPRNTYQSSMAKQALGIMRAHHMACFNGKHKVLAYPTRPLFEPQINQLLNLNAYPQGEMVWVAFGEWTGNTQEDAVVWNRASIDMGKFRIFKFNNNRVTFKSEGGKVEKLQRPTKISDEQLKTRFQHIGRNGLPKLGAHIKERQAVVGKVVMEGKEEIHDDSLLLGYGEEGIVDKVMVTNNGAVKIVNVRLRMMRIPIEGDKFAPRNAQKGTIGKILDPEDMPYTEDGIIPDIIVNSHATPSRMTIAYQMELLAGVAGAIVGQRQNATAFRPFDKARFKSILRDYGYSDTGKRVMYSGTTGRKIEAEIYNGPAYFQALRHHVQDKIQARRTGPYSATSRQPVKGRAKMGGLRFGEMERDAAIAHGAAYFLQERLCGVSDCYKSVYCKCGQIATGSLNTGYRCRSCGDVATFGELEITAALKLLNMFLAGFGFKQVFKFSEEEEQRSRMFAGGHLAQEEREYAVEDDFSDDES